MLIGGVCISRMLVISREGMILLKLSVTCIVCFRSNFLVVCGVGPMEGVVDRKRVRQACFTAMARGRNGGVVQHATVSIGFVFKFELPTQTAPLLCCHGWHCART